MEDNNIRALFSSQIPSVPDTFNVIVVAFGMPFRNIKQQLEKPCYYQGIYLSNNNKKWLLFLCHSFCSSIVSAAMAMLVHYTQVR